MSSVSRLVLPVAIGLITLAAPALPAALAANHTPANEWESSTKSVSNGPYTADATVRTGSRSIELKTTVRGSEEGKNHEAPPAPRSASLTTGQPSGDRGSRGTGGPTTPAGSSGTTADGDTTPPGSRSWFDERGNQYLPLDNGQTLLTTNGPGKPRDPFTTILPRRAPDPPLEAVVETGGAVDGEIEAVARGVALELRDEIRLPDMQIKANPGLGVVALPSWFWVEGYRGETLGASRAVTIPREACSTDAVGVQTCVDASINFTVEVRVSPSRYEWAFGDGGSLATRSLGQAYPNESDIQHRYEFSSRGATEGFPLVLRATFAAEFSVNGASEALPPVGRTYEARHQVREVQSILLAGR